jgi:hydroxyacid-oxoacid transhydrogenase
VFGAGALAEAGDRARDLGLTRVALFTDPRVATGEPFAKMRSALAAEGVEAAIYDQVTVETTDASWQAAARVAAGVEVDGHASGGGGLDMDTCKAAHLHLCVTPVDAGRDKLKSLFRSALR